MRNASRVTAEELRRVLQEARRLLTQDLIVFDVQLYQRADGSISKLKLFCAPYVVNNVVTADKIMTLWLRATRATEAHIAKILRALANMKLIRMKADVVGNNIFHVLEVSECNECDNMIEANIEGIAKRTPDGSRVWIVTMDNMYLVSDLTIKGMTLCGEAVTGIVYAIFGNVVQGMRYGLNIIQGLHYQLLDRKTEVKAEELMQNEIKELGEGDEKSQENV